MTSAIGIYSELVREVIPQYLATVPIPKEYKCINSLTKDEKRHLAIFTAVIVGVLYFVGRPCIEKYLLPKHPKVNHNKKLKKGKPFICDTIDIEDLGTETYMCRCWKSKKFPYCDGSHKKHNKQCSDNVGPLVIKKQKVVVEELLKKGKKPPLKRSGTIIDKDDNSRHARLKSRVI